jgi:hypothetical protein
MQATVSDDMGHVAAAQETTLFSRDGSGGQFALTLTGAPRTLRIGVVTTMIYMIKFQNEVSRQHQRSPERRLAAGADLRPVGAPPSASTATC